MHFFYVLYSLKDGKLYKGCSGQLGKRLIKHFNGGVPSTKHRRPLVLIYHEVFDNKSEALARESWSKTAEGGLALKARLVDNRILSEKYDLII